MDSDNKEEDYKQQAPQTTMQIAGMWASENKYGNLGLCGSIKKRLTIQENVFKEKATDFDYWLRVSNWYPGCDKVPKRKSKAQLITICGLKRCKRKDKNGNPMLVGALGRVNVMVQKNIVKINEEKKPEAERRENWAKWPDWSVFFSQVKYMGNTPMKKVDVKAKAVQRKRMYYGKGK